MGYIKQMALVVVYLALSAEVIRVHAYTRTFTSHRSGSARRAVRSSAVMRPRVTMSSEDSQNPGLSKFVAPGLLAAAALTVPFIGGAARAADTPQQAAMMQSGRWRYSEFIHQVESDRVEKVTFSADGHELLAIDTDGGRHKLDALPNDATLLSVLTAHNVDVTVLPQEASVAQNGGGDFITSLIFPFALLTGLFLLSRGRGDEGGSPGGGGGFGPGGMGQGNPTEFGKMRSKIQMNPDTGVTFEDVAGCDSAKLELVEVVDFLKNPDKYTRAGAEIPRGVLLDGPPGTGKTLLAKAVAGEAGVPFYPASGSEFVEMFVGVGASRVRDLFGQAKKNAPCIIFIDEIDAVGRTRGAGFAGGNDEREQTLNQILTEMDGFEGNPGIITIAATNRADVLDSALVRPGRFDRRVTVGLPDLNGRIAVLKVHARGKPLETGVDLEGIARRTPGFSGASLQNLLNEAAINAARKGKTAIGYDEIDAAVDRQLVGKEKKDAEMSEQRRKLVAYHEAGHAVAGAMIPDYDMIQKITIVPRTNGAGGLTFFSPDEGRLNSGMYSQQYLQGQLAVALGGRIAEELIFGEGDITTGASNDLQQVSSIAGRMVKEWGMSPVVGPIMIGEGGGGQPFMGANMGGGGGDSWSDETTRTAEREIERLVNRAYATCKDILSSNMELLHTVADRLLEQETVSAEEFQVMVMEKGQKMAPYELYGEREDGVYPFTGELVIQ